MILMRAESYDFGKFPVDEIFNWVGFPKRSDNNHEGTIRFAADRSSMMLIADDDYQKPANYPNSTTLPRIFSNSAAHHTAILTRSSQ